MRRRFIVVLVVAAVMGLVASLLTYQVVTQLQTRPRTEPSEAIVVSAVNMDMAEMVTSKHVSLVPWPKESIPKGALRSLADAEGRVVRNSIVAGEPVLEGKLAPPLAGAGGIMPMLVPEGHRGVTIKVNEAIRESGFVLPNSRVDVLVSMTRDGSRDRVAKVILQDVLVLAAGQAVEMRDAKPVSVTTVTLALTPGESEHLAVAQAEGPLMLATRNLRDRQIVQTRGATAANLLASSTPPPRESAAAQMRRTVAPPTPTPAFKTQRVWVLRAEKVSVQDFIRRDDHVWVEQK